MDISIPTPDGSVPGTLIERGSDIAVLLAHGAGAGQRHPWMVAMRDRIAACGTTVMTFDYRYIADGRKAPDRLPRLLDTHDAAARFLATRTAHVILAGKSMGGRVGGHLVAERGFEASGLCYFGYPLVAMGKTEPRSTRHLEEIEVPQLFVSGSRDRMGPTDLLEDVVGRIPNAVLEVVDGGDHSLVPLKSSGSTLDESLDLAVTMLHGWIASTVRPQATGGT